MAEWEAYDTLEPFGSPRDDFRVGLICSTVANFSQISRKHNYVPHDLLPSPVDVLRKAKQTLSQQILEGFRFITGKR